MKKGKVVDMFSRTAMDVNQQNTKANDKLTEEHGRYIGSVHKDTAEEIRNRMQSLNSRSMQIEAMIQGWETDYKAHMLNLYSIMKMLGVKVEDFNPQTQEVMISENGDMWIVDLPKPGSIH